MEMPWGRFWTAEEKYSAISLRRSGRNYAEIAELLNRRVGSVKGFLNRNHIFVDPAVRHRVRQLAQINRKKPKKEVLHYRPADFIGHVTKVDIPPAVIAERDNRADEPRTLNMILLGDPPFSQSALARVPREPGLVQSRESLRD